MAEHDAEILREIHREDIPDIGEDNKLLIKFGEALFNVAQQFKVDDQKLHDKWSKARRWVDGDQWEKKRDAHLSEPVTNFIFANCETIQSLTINTRPLLEIESRNYKKAQEIRKVIDNNLWYRLRMPRTRKLVVKDFVQLGNGFIKTIWDPFALNGLGELSINYTDPFSLFPQPHQPNLQDCKYVFHAFPVFISELLDIYGDKALNIQPEDVSARLKKQRKKGIMERIGRRILSPITDTKGLVTEQYIGGSAISQVFGREKEMVLFFELWYKDSRREKRTFADDDLINDEHQAFAIGTTPSVTIDDDHEKHIAAHKKLLESDRPENDDDQEKIVRKRIEEHISTHEAFPDLSTRIKYDGGRVISWAGQTLLDDKENPFLHGRFPWSHYKNYERGDEFWADGEVEQMMSPQLIHNRVEALAVDHAIMTANSPWIISSDAGVDEDTIINSQGMIINVNGDVNTGIRREPPAQLSSDIPFLLGNSKQGTEIVSGIPEATQGRRPTGITSGRALESLKASALNRITPKTEQIMFGDQELYEQMTKLMGQFYKEDRIFQQIGDDGTPQNITLTPDDFKDELIITLRSRDELGASLESRFQIALMLIQIGGMTPDLLLEYLDLPGFAVLKQKFLERQQQLAGLPQDNTDNGTQNKNPAGELLGQSKLGTNSPGV